MKENIEDFTPGSEIQENFEDHDPLFLEGQTITVNPHTFTADVLIGKQEVLEEVPILGVIGGSGTRDVSWVTDFNNADVLLVLVGGNYKILTTIPRKVSAGNAKSQTSYLLEQGYGGDNKDTYGVSYAKNYKNNRPSDMYTGDKVLHTTDGILMGLFKGGVARLKASSLAQIVLLRLKDLVRIVSRNFQLFSDFGEMEVKHKESGRVSASLKGGAVFKDETHPQKAKWTVQTYFGDFEDDEDSRLYVKVNDVEDSEFVTLKFDTKGNMTLETSNNKDSTIGNDELTTVENNRETTVKNDDVLDVQNNRETNVMKNESKSVLGQYQETVSKDSSENVGGAKNLQAAKEILIKSDKIVTITAPTVQIN